MRIGLLIYGSLDTLSGGYLYDRNLMEYLEKQGETAEIISLPWRNYRHHLADNFSSSLFRRLIGLQCDVLLQDELNHPSLFILNRKLRNKIRYPIVSIVHHLLCCEEHPFWLNHLYRSVESCYLSNLDGFICNSHATQEMVLNLTGGEKIRNYVANPGKDRFNPQINQAEICSRSSQEGALRLLFAGNIIPRKGLHILLKALKRLPSDQFTLNVIGNPEMDPRYFQSISRQVRRDGLAGQVNFRGILSDTNLARCIRASHLFVMPSYYEGYGIIYLEAMGFGLPAIGTCHGGAKEIITHGADGFLITPGDDEMLAEYLAELAENRELLLRLSLAALNHYHSLPTWEDSMKRIHTFLRELVQG